MTVYEVEFLGDQIAITDDKKCFYRKHSNFNGCYSTYTKWKRLKEFKIFHKSNKTWISSNEGLYFNNEITKKFDKIKLPRKLLEE